MCVNHPCGAVPLVQKAGSDVENDVVHHRNYLKPTTVGQFDVDAVLVQSIVGNRGNEPVISVDRVRSVRDYRQDGHRVVLVAIVMLLHCPTQHLNVGLVGICAGGRPRTAAVSPVLDRQRAVIVCDEQVYPGSAGDSRRSPIEQRRRAIVARVLDLDAGIAAVGVEGYQ